MHLDDEKIHRLMHGELNDDARRASLAHMQQCATCADAFESARHDEAEIFGLFEHLDHDAPAVDAARFRGPVRGQAAAWGRRAAGIVVVAALAGAAYAIPGSPLPDIIKRLAGQTSGEQPITPAAVDVSTPDAPVTSGIAVFAGENFTIQFADAQSAGTMTVSLTDDRLVRVRVVGGTAAFTTDAGRLDIANSQSNADYEIEIPRSAPSVEIRVGPALLFYKDGEEVITDSRADAHGVYEIPVMFRP